MSKTNGKDGEDYSPLRNQNQRHRLSSDAMDEPDVLMNPNLKFSQFLCPFAVKSVPIVLMRAAPFV